MHSTERLMTKQQTQQTPDEMHFAIGDSSLGLVLVARTETGINALLLGDDRDALIDDLNARFPDARVVDGGAAMTELVARVVAFIESPAGGLDLPLDLRGTEFQRKVWQALRGIAPGSTASYLEI